MSKPAKPKLPLTPAQQELVVNHQRWLHRRLSDRRMRGYVRRFDTYEDAYQTATLGLIEAARRFDINRGCHFSTYAQFWVLQKLEVMTVGMSAKYMVAARQDRRNGGHMQYRPQADLYRHTPEDEPSALDAFVGRNDDVLDAAPARELFALAKRLLDPRYWFVVRLRCEGETLDHIASTLGISKERVRQMEYRAMNWLRARLPIYSTHGCCPSAMQ